MKDHCSYHPTKENRWHCTHCLFDFCDHCTVSDQRSKGAFCPNCGNEAEFLPNTKDLVPFWRCINVFFKYPLSYSPLGFIIVSTIMTFFFSFSLLGGIAILILTALQYRYGFLVIERVAQGEKSPPSVSEVIQNPGFHLVIYALIMMLVIAANVWFVAAKLHLPVLALILLVIYLLVLPLMVMILATSHSLIQAISPVAWLATISKIGPSYLLMYLYLILMGACSAAVANLGAAFFTPQVATFASAIISNYFLLVSFSLMGYVIHQNRFALGLGATQHDLKIQAHKKQPQALEWALANADFKGALLMLEKQLGNAEEVALAWPKYRKLLLQTEQLPRWIKKYPSLHLALFQNSEETKHEAVHLLVQLFKQKQLDFDDPNRALNIAKDVSALNPKLAFRMIQNHIKPVQDIHTKRDLVTLAVDLLKGPLQQPALADKYQGWFAAIEKQFKRDAYFGGSLQTKATQLGLSTDY